MTTVMIIHLSTGEQEMNSTQDIMIIPRIGENIKNHKGAFEIVKDVTYAYLKEGLSIHVYT